MKKPGIIDKNNELLENPHEKKLNLLQIRKILLIFRIYNTNIVLIASCLIYLNGQLKMRKCLINSNLTLTEGFHI